METKAHWEKVYQTKAPDAVSWFAPHLDTSLKLITQATEDRQVAIIDVGGDKAGAPVSQAGQARDRFDVRTARPGEVQRA